ncbi:MAG: HPr family phosphocarrier protein [Albidovulum sp.]|nr:HPr family phosphocarrier protein [Albidovulum sp.]MDE0303332.1 HPr family phosphocarrier protein [Albidovulum sp.]MDE0534208.1 HPr family phosphocarrier protein [Albidovulum sp.]
MKGHDAEIQWVDGKAKIIDLVGLHARPAVKLTKLAKSYKSEVEICSGENRNWVNAKSPNAVMKLRADYNSPLFVRASGSDAAQAVKAIIDLVDRNFNE